ncbi:MAG: hypothetical protein Q7T03_06935, partial [Deltaproteobacteria bacterium]|nr:hypothetical protein [Deltaproteobacteria bacterium]
STFKEPQCSESGQNCFVVDYLDPFRHQRLPDHVVPAVFENSEKLKHLGEGIRGLLSSYRFAEWVQASDAGNDNFTDGGVPILLGESYLGRAVSELQQAGAMNAIYTGLRMFTNKLDACTKGMDTCLTQQEVLMALNNITLGFLYIFEKEYSYLEEGREEPSVPVPAESKQVEEKKEEKSEEQKPKPKEYNNPPRVAIEGKSDYEPGERVRLTAKAIDPDGDPVTYEWKQLRGSPVELKDIHSASMEFIAKRWDGVRDFQVTVTDVPDKKHGGKPKSATATHEVSVNSNINGNQQLQDFAEGTGGRQRSVPFRDRIEPLPKEPGREDALIGAIKEALVIPDGKKKNYYQFMIVVDKSGSMTDDIEKVRQKAADIFAFAKSQLTEGGEVGIAVRFYVDEVYNDNGEVVPLDAPKELAMRRLARMSPEVRDMQQDWIEGVVDGAKKSWKEFRNGKEVPHSNDREVREAQAGLEKIVKNVGGGIEYHWEAAMNAMDNEPWADKPGVERVVVLITDEGDDNGSNILKYSKHDAIARAKEKGIRFEHILLENSNKYGGWGGGGCFGGATYVRLENGALMTMGELHTMMLQGGELPKMASFDETSGQIIYQTPTAFMQRPLVDGALLYVNVEGKADSLEVTPNHPMLVQKEAGSPPGWVTAGELHSGDKLVNPEGDPFVIQSIRTETGAFDVFNLSFSEEKTGMHPTYLVSPDGLTWFVAHNIAY